MNDDIGGAVPTCRDDSGGGGGLPAEANWGPLCIPPDPNAGGPLLAGPGVLEGGKIGPVVKGDDDPKGLRLGRELGGATCPVEGKALGGPPEVLMEEGNEPRGGGLDPKGGGGPEGLFEATFWGTVACGGPLGRTPGGGTPGRVIGNDPENDEGR